MFCRGWAPAEEIDQTAGPQKALEICLTLERAEKLAREGTLTEARARELVGEIVQRTSGESLQFFTVKQWFRHWLDGKIDSKAERTGERYEQIAREFVEFLGGRATLNLAAITSREVLGFRRLRAAKGLAPSTVNLDITIIGGAFNAAKRQGYIPTNPCTAIEPLPEEDKIEEGRVHSETCSRVAGRCRRDKKWSQNLRGWRRLARAILFAFYTGARLQDVANMRWESIDLVSKVVTYFPRKTRKARRGRGVVVVPIHPELEVYLLGLGTPDDGKAFLFPKLAGTETGGRTGCPALSRGSWRARKLKAL